MCKSWWVRAGVFACYRICIMVLFCLSFSLSLSLTLYISHRFYQYLSISVSISIFRSIIPFTLRQRHYFIQWHTFLSLRFWCFCTVCSMCTLCIYILYDIADFRVLPNFFFSACCCCYCFYTQVFFSTLFLRFLYKHT